MKTVVLIRHGKSSWKYNVNDRERPLKKVGIQNTIKVCNQFKINSEIQLQNVFSSPAKRARDTCDLFIQTYNATQEFNVEINEDLYDFDGASLKHFIKSLDNDLDTVFIFGHNNAFNNFVNTFGDVYIENVPTSGLVNLEFDINNWSDLKPGVLKLKLFPKALY
ncbi:histidine phosphatase family protein [Formosa undariae]|uniref:Histidine phosphatase family protein n=1 Tax=Formosa undariae TaxID=1325436 RepID=A0ABV5F473_9FLAO